MDEELLVRQMPHSVEAEQAVLGSMLIDVRCVPAVIEKLRPEDFYLKQNRDIYETIYSMFSLSETIDPVTVLDHMRLGGVFDENTSRSYILQLMEVTPTAANVGEYIEIVKDKSLLRRIAETAGDLTAMVQEGTGTAQEVLDAAEQRIYAIRQGRSSQGLTPISSVVLDVLDRLEELSKLDAAVPGLSTGLPDVDAAISGLNNSDLILLAARPGMGKTSFALNVLLQVGRIAEIRLDFAGSPSFHGENGFCSEHHPECRHPQQCAHSGILSGNEPGTVSHAPHLQRGLCR